MSLADEDSEEQVVMTHQEVLHLLAQEGLPGALVNAGGGCLAY